MTQAAILAAAGSPGTTTGFKNKLINGAFTVSQYNGTSVVTPTASSTYQIDRWCVLLGVSSKFSVQQSSTAPAGFTNSALITSLSAYSLSSSDYFAFTQRLEGLNTYDLAWGTANAKTITISAWVQSSLTGTFGGSLRNNGASRSYPFTYSIPTANTWTQISITIAGDTSGSYPTNNTESFEVDFGLGAGSTYSGTAGAWASANYVTATSAVSVVSTNAATWYITGVQLEVGTTATNFDFRSIGTELALCQRYYELNYPYGTAPGTVGTDNSPNTIAFYANNTSISAMGGAVYWKVPKRATPSVTIYSSGSGGASTPGYVHPSGGSDITGVVSNIGTNNSFIYAGSYNFYFNWTASAEL